MTTVRASVKASRPRSPNCRRASATAAVSSDTEVTGIGIAATAETALTSRLSPATAAPRTSSGSRDDGSHVAPPRSRSHARAKQKSAHESPRTTTHGWGLARTCCRRPHAVTGPLQRLNRAGSGNQGDAGTRVQPAHVPDIAVGRRRRASAEPVVASSASAGMSLSAARSRRGAACREIVSAGQRSRAHPDHQGEQRINLGQVKVDHLRGPRLRERGQRDQRRWTARPRLAAG